VILSTGKAPVGRDEDNRFMPQKISDLPDENSKRFLAILNEKIELGRLLNALGHMSAGLVGQLGGVSDLCFLEYRDKDGGAHPSISHFPFIVLKAENSNQIRKVRGEALARGLPFTDFTQTMIVGTSAAQLEATAQSPEQELEYFGICLFSETAVLREFTKKFSLFK
jgi:hypothetical protein